MKSIFRINLSFLVVLAAFLVSAQSRAESLLSCSDSTGRIKVSAREGRTNKVMTLDWNGVAKLSITQASTDYNFQWVSKQTLDIHETMTQGGLGGPPAPLHIESFIAFATVERKDGKSLHDNSWCDGVKVDRLAEWLVCTRQSW